MKKMKKMKVKDLLKICRNDIDLIYVYDNDMKPVYASDVEEFYEFQRKENNPDFVKFGLKATVETFKIKTWDLVIVANEKFKGEI